MSTGHKGYENIYEEIQRNTFLNHALHALKIGKASPEELNNIVENVLADMRKKSSDFSLDNLNTLLGHISGAEEDEAIYYARTQQHLAGTSLENIAKMRDTLASGISIDKNGHYVVTRIDGQSITGATPAPQQEKVSAAPTPLSALDQRQITRIEAHMQSFKDDLESFDGLDDDAYKSAQVEEGSVIRRTKFLDARIESFSKDPNGQDAVTRLSTIKEQYQAALSAFLEGMDQKVLDAEMARAQAPTEPKIQEPTEAIAPTEPTKPVEPAKPVEAKEAPEAPETAKATEKTTEVTVKSGDTIWAMTAAHFGIEGDATALANKVNEVLALNGLDQESTRLIQAGQVIKFEGEALTANNLENTQPQKEAEATQPKEPAQEAPSQTNIAQVTPDEVALKIAEAATLVANGTITPETFEQIKAQLEESTPLQTQPEAQIVSIDQPEAPAQHTQEANQLTAEQQQHLASLAMKVANGEMTAETFATIQQTFIDNSVTIDVAEPIETVNLQTVETCIPVGAGFKIGTGEYQISMVNDQGLSPTQCFNVQAHAEGIAMMPKEEADAKIAQQNAPATPSVTQGLEGNQNYQVSIGLGH